jgi:hypothetical protein
MYVSMSYNAILTVTPFAVSVMLPVSIIEVTSDALFYQKVYILL